jgi:hypothetical protein
VRQYHEAYDNYSFISTPYPDSTPAQPGTEVIGAKASSRRQRDQGGSPAKGGGSDGITLEENFLDLRTLELAKLYRIAMVPRNIAFDRYYSAEDEVYSNYNEGNAFENGQVKASEDDELLDELVSLSEKTSPAPSSTKTRKKRNETTTEPILEPVKPKENTPLATVVGEYQQVFAILTIQELKVLLIGGWKGLHEYCLSNNGTNVGQPKLSQVFSNDAALLVHLLEDHPGMQLLNSLPQIGSGGGPEEIYWQTKGDNLSEIMKNILKHAQSKLIKKGKNSDEDKFDLMGRIYLLVG